MFIDFKKTFDSIHRGEMLKIIRAYVIPEPVFAVIGLLYPGRKAKVSLPDGETEFFEILAISWGPTRRHTGSLYFHHHTELCHETSYWK